MAGKIFISPVPLTEGPQDIQTHVPALFRVELTAHHVAPGNGGGEFCPVLGSGNDSIVTLGGVEGVDEVDTVPFLHSLEQRVTVPLGEVEFIPADVGHLSR